MLTPSASSPVIKIALYRASSIGDVVLATACIHLLRQIPVPVQITWVGRRPALQLIASAFPEIKTVEVDKDIGNYQDRVIQELKDVHFILDLQTNFRSQRLCLALKRQYNIPTYVCLKRSFDRGAMTFAARLRGRRRALPESYVNSTNPQFALMTKALKHALSVHLPIEALDGIDSIEAFPILPTMHDSGQQPWQKELKFGRWIAIATGAAHETKKAPVAYLKATLELLQGSLRDEPNTAENSVGLLFVGDDQDREHALAILDSLNWSGPNLNLAGKLSLWETALALKNTSILLCNDSGLLHIAEAVGVPVAALFGPTVEAFGFAPWRADSIAFSSLLGCRPCSKHGQADCRFQDKLCFGLIQKSEVAAHLHAHLQNTQGMLRG